MFGQEIELIDIKRRGLSYREAKPLVRMKARQEAEFTRQDVANQEIIGKAAYILSYGPHHLHVNRDVGWQAMFLAFDYYKCPEERVTTLEEDYLLVMRESTLRPYGFIKEGVEHSHEVDRTLWMHGTQRKDHPFSIWYRRSSVDESVWLVRKLHDSPEKAHYMLEELLVVAPHEQQLRTLLRI